MKKALSFAFVIVMVCGLLTLSSMAVEACYRQKKGL